MCKFFSAISNGKGKVLFFKVEDVVKIMSEGNKEGYDFNSHSSIASFNGIKADKEDVALTLKLPNFNYKIFEEITGITKEMFDKKLKS